MKIRLLICCMFACGVFKATANIAKVTICAIDDNTELPIAGALTKAWFEQNIGWRAWSEASPIAVTTAKTEEDGCSRLTGKTNTGEISFCAFLPDEYYKVHGSYKYVNKNVLSVWQPEDLVITMRLQHIERPIPLWVKKVDYRVDDLGKNSLANRCLQYDMIKGDWLPPYGKGVCADLEISSKLQITGTKRKFLYATKKVEDIEFYELVQTISLPNPDDIWSMQITNSLSGIRIRCATDEGSRSCMERKIGMREGLSPSGDWQCEYFSDYNRNCCFVFRIRTKYNEKGEIVSAYYGKIYGDFEFEGTLKEGLKGINFLYYLNTTPLDRNLEWDMKNNLCPEETRTYPFEP